MNARFILIAALIASTFALLPEAAACSPTLCGPHPIPPIPPLPCASVNCLVADAVGLANGVKATALCLVAYAGSLETIDWLAFDPLHDRLPTQTCVNLNVA